MIVIKFGGTSVQDADAILRAAELVRGRLTRAPMVVVSAMSGVTNQLLDIAARAARGELVVAISQIEQLRERHLTAADSLLAGTAEQDEICSELSATCDELASLAGALDVLGDLTPRSLDVIAATGEVLSSQLIAAAFRGCGLPADHVDARRVLITDDEFGSATPLMEPITQASRGELLPSVQAGRVPVLGGFVGATAGGITTTLGRGGSDYSAALIGAVLDAAAIEIWTDVDGLLTADPRVVPEAQLIDHIRFDEAAELASFGAKVLHPSTIAPAVRRGIPVHVFNARRPDGGGTRITADAPPRRVRAIAGKGGVTVVKVNTSRMLLAHGFLRRLFEVFERHRTAVDVVATSEISVSVTIDDPSRLDRLLVDLATLGDVSVERGRGIVALVGASLGGHAATIARALGALGDMRVHMLSLSATEINLTLIVDDEQMVPAMRALHAEFFSGSADA